jgi:hypothetical protein
MIALLHVISKESRPYGSHHRLFFKVACTFALCLPCVCAMRPQTDVTWQTSCHSGMCICLIATATRTCIRYVSNESSTHAPSEGSTRRECSTASAGTLRRPCDKHIISSLAESRLLTSANNATCVTVVRRRCQRSRFQKKHRSSIPRNWSMHVSQQSRVLLPCRLTDPSFPGETRRVASAVTV